MVEEMIVDVREATTEDIETVKTWPIWEKEISEFDWTYNDKETCYILEGHAEIYDSDGNMIASLTKGDYVSFPKGLDCRWKITRNMKKHYNFG